MRGFWQQDPLPDVSITPLVLLYPQEVSTTPITWSLLLQPDLPMKTEPLDKEELAGVIPQSELALTGGRQGGQLQAISPPLSSRTWSTKRSWTLGTL